MHLNKIETIYRQKYNESLTLSKWKVFDTDISLIWVCYTCVGYHTPSVYSIYRHVYK